MVSTLVTVSRFADVLILSILVSFACLVVLGLDDGVPMSPIFKFFSPKPMVPMVPFDASKWDSITWTLTPISASLTSYCSVMCSLAVAVCLALCFQVYRSGLGTEKKMELVNLVVFWAIGGFGVIWDFHNMVNEERPQEAWNALHALANVAHVYYECLVAPCIILRSFPSGFTMFTGLSLAAVVNVAVVQSGLVCFTRWMSGQALLTLFSHTCGKLAITTLNMDSLGNQLALFLWWCHALPELLSCVFESECSHFILITAHCCLVAPALCLYVRWAIMVEGEGPRPSAGLSCTSSPCRVAWSSPQAERKRQ